MARVKTHGKSNRRNEILQAAKKLMRSRGLAAVTTRQISKEVGCSEGALYVHFNGRLELLLAMLEESLPDMLGPLQTLRESVGRGSPQANLQAALQGIFNFHRGIVSETGSLFAERELLLAYRRSLARQRKGPHLSMGVLAEYIRAEQKLGRIDSSVEAQMAAYLLMSSSFFRAFLEQFFGEPIQPSLEVFAPKVVAAVVPQAAKKDTGKTEQTV